MNRTNRIPREIVCINWDLWLITYLSCFKLYTRLDHQLQWTRRYCSGKGDFTSDNISLWKGPVLVSKCFLLLRILDIFIYRFRVYTGKEDPMTTVSAVLPTECQNFGVSEKMVVYLVLPLLNSGYTVWMDNWYSSCKLYSYLHSRRTMACGTVRANRVPLEVKNSKPATGEQRAYCSGPLLCLKFRDKKDIFMLSSQHSESMEDACRSRGRPSVAHVRSKPGSIIEYNRNMGSVDWQDQLLEPYSAARKSMKWYKKLSFHLLQLAMLNSHILYQKTGGKKTFLQFEHDVIAEFLMSDTEPHAGKLESVTRLTERHFPSVLEPTPTWTKLQSRCRVSSKQGRRKDVKTVCAQCPTKPGLCAVPCFGLWHSKLRYWE